MVVTVALDQLTKWWATESLGDGSVVDVAPGLEFELTYNSGFSFSTGSGSGSLIGWLVIALSIAMVVMIARARTTTRVALVAVILGGALGNLADRLFRAQEGFLSGEVVDFIDVTWYAVFNLADTFVVCGAIALVLFEARAGRHGDPTGDRTERLEPEA